MGKAVKRQYDYQYGSEAKEYYSAVPAPSITPSPRPKTIPQRKLDVSFALQLSACGAVLFIGSFLYLNTYAAFNMKQVELKSTKTEIRKMNSTISLTEAKISEKLNLDYIRERAANELDMSEPLPHQIVYIELPKQSYTIYGD